MTENLWKVEAFRAALRAVEGGEPRDLVKRAQPEAEDRGTSLSPADLAEILEAATPTDGFLSALGIQVQKWDAAANADSWADGTEPSTPERRSVICGRLGLDDAGAAALLSKRPIFRDQTIVITAPWEDWYSPERAAAHSLYWPAYQGYLREVRGWPDENVVALDLATDDVVRRLADPTRAEAYQSKGLVVGYVQSGKTANFTGVVAKAIDAGYRLIVVMTGTIEMLRAQTQRRMDMEMVGRQNILGDLSPQEAIDAGVDYQDDDAWGDDKFIDHGLSELSTEIIRLTGHHADYKKQFRTLKIDRVEKSRPLYDPENLFRTGARIAIVKKNAAVLKKLVDDIKANVKAFAEIPVLIVDDESDQASVNTVDPGKIAKAKQEGKEIKERRAINERIATMLELMPRAQYVGYTATPFANVFTDPGDDQGIFPKDFVIGLPRPPGYMGVDDFHDLEPPTGVRTFTNSNETAFVRRLDAGDDDIEAQDQELAEAVDMFVLAGAVKLYRKERDPDFECRHHTMLVHQSVKKDDHLELADRIRELWRAADFAGAKAKARLRERYEADIAPVSLARVEPGISVAPPFDELESFIPQSVQLIAENDHNPVLVVNSDKEVQENQQDLDFDRNRTWRVLVGGAKLSRGFTVEGLTVTYFRRAVEMADSLTQMGRWFGFRPGYRDLVRLYIARRATFKSGTIDLYEAFESVALDESAFRAQLQKYAEWSGDEPLVRPIDIPPLVSQHLPWLRPTAKNKMFNAVLEEQSEQPFTPSGYANRLDHLHENLDRWRAIFQAAVVSVELPEHPGFGTFDAYLGVVSAAELLEAIEHTHYLPYYAERAVNPKVAFYRRLVDNHSVEDFLVVAPQPATELVDLGAVGPRAVISRDRRAGRGGKFGEITDRKHRECIVRFVGGRPTDALTSYLTPTRGAVLLYLARESEPSYEPSADAAPAHAEPERGLVAAFSAYLPEPALLQTPHVLRFRVRDPEKKDQPTIEDPSNH